MKLHSQVLEDHDASHNNKGKEGSIAGNHHSKGTTEDSTSSPATIRRRGTRSRVLEDQLRSSEQSENENKDIDLIPGNQFQDRPERLEDFTANPGDVGVSAKKKDENTATPVSKLKTKVAEFATVAICEGMCPFYFDQ